MRIRSIEFIAIFALASASCRGQIISTFAGDDVPNTSCSQADGVPAISACMHPSGIAMDKAGNVYLSDGQFFKI